MSKIARWSYTNTATIKPFVSRDEWGVITYGPEYQIKCTWTAENKQATTPAGLQFIGRHYIYTEDARPKYLDMVQLKGHSDWEEIKSHTEWDASMFKDPMPDYLLITG